jgi:hypothetical protein
MNAVSNQNKRGCNFSTVIIVIVILFILFTCVSRHRDGCHCWDGTESFATGRGACSHHGGVMYWTYEYWWSN